MHAETFVPHRLARCLLSLPLLAVALRGQEAAVADKAAPVFKDGQAPVVQDLAAPKEWIRQRLWVETEFASDGDGKKVAVVLLGKRR